MNNVPDGTGQAGPDEDLFVRFNRILGVDVPAPSFRDTCRTAIDYTNQEWLAAADDYARAALDWFGQTFDWDTETIHCEPLAPGLCRLTVDDLIFEAHGTDDLIMFRLATTCPVCKATTWAEDVITREMVGWHLEHPTKCATCFGAHSHAPDRITLADLETLRDMVGSTAEDVHWALRQLNDAKRVAEAVKASLLLDAYQKQDGDKSPIAQLLGTGPSNAETRAHAETVYLFECDAYQQSVIEVERLNDAYQMARIQNLMAETDKTLVRAFLDSTAHHK